jgi:methyl-accepting chemotaxis protein
VKSAFLQNMSDQMVAPVKTIVQAVDTIGQSYATMEQEENSRLVDSIQENADQIGEILNEILDVATGNKEAKGKEGLA